MVALGEICVGLGNFVGLGFLFEPLLEDLFTRSQLRFGLFSLLKDLGFCFLPCGLLLRPGVFRRIEVYNRGFFVLWLGLLELLGFWAWVRERLLFLGNVGERLWNRLLDGHRNRLQNRLKSRRISGHLYPIFEFLYLERLMRRSMSSEVNLCSLQMVLHHPLDLGS